MSTGEQDPTPEQRLADLNVELQTIVGELLNAPEPLVEKRIANLIELCDYYYQGSEYNLLLSGVALERGESGEFGDRELDDESIRVVDVNHLEWVTLDLLWDTDYPYTSVRVSPDLLREIEIVPVQPHEPEVQELDFNATFSQIGGGAPWRGGCRGLRG